MLLLSGTSNHPLADELAQQLEIDQLKVEIEQFPNSERRVWVQGDVVNQNVVVLQSLTTPVDERIMELLLLTDALERAGADQVHAIIPWLGYSLQDKVFRPGESLSAKVVANLISQSFIDRVLLLDLHNNSIPGFFSVPTTVLSGLELFARYIEQRWNHNNLVVCSPDFGGLKRARELAIRLGVNLTNIDKQRDLQTGQVTATAVHGDVKSKTVIIFDDCIVGGGTVIESAKILKESGAKEVHFVSTHGLFTGDAQDRIAESEVDSVIITNSIHHPQLSNKISLISVTPLFTEVLRQWL